MDQIVSYELQIIKVNWPYSKRWLLDHLSDETMALYQIYPCSILTLSLRCHLLYQRHHLFQHWLILKIENLRRHIL